MSSHLHRAVAPGDHVSIAAPGGSFVLPLTSRQPVVLFAGGIGITPFISYLESLQRGSATPEVWLYYANQNSSTHAFRTRIRELSGSLPRLCVFNYYSAPLDVDRAGIDYDSRGFISADVISDSLVARRARFYLCGPEPMMKVITDGLMKRGVPRFDIFKEAFRSPGRLNVDPNQRHVVEFSRSGLREVWSPEKGSLLTFAEKLGIALSSGCRVGQCESCAIRVLTGTVSHLHGSEPDESDTCLACQAVPVSELVLDA